jgi:aspartate racemase
MSWESTLHYYRIINQAVNERLGGHHSARIVMYSVDFAQVEVLLRVARWVDMARMMVEAARRIENAGADFLLICTNTVHGVAKEVQEGISIPLVHIVDATAESIKSQSITTVGLLGTALTMEEGFYEDRMAAKHGIEVMVPEEGERRLVDRIIFEELCHGIAKPSSRDEFKAIAASLVSRGAGGIILGCTEIPLLLGEEDVPAPVFDSTEIHALAAVEYALHG